MALEQDLPVPAIEIAFGAAVALFIGIALVAGGSSTSPISALVVRLAALPIGVWAIWRLAARGLTTRALLATGLMGAAVLLVLAQLTPLPPRLWASLPGRAQLVAVYRVAGMPTPWLPMSIAPAATWDAALSLIAPAATFLATLTLGLSGRRGVAAVVVLVALCSLTLGILQVAGGGASPLRFYQVTNPNSAVGFFANRNHEAMLLVASIPFAGLVAARFPEARGGDRLFWLALAGTGALVLCVGLAATRSRAGVLLALPAALGEAVVLALCSSVDAGSRARRLVPALAMVAALALGSGLVAGLNLTPLAARFAQPARDELRLAVAPSLLALAHRYDPVGAGVGSFQSVYGTIERPESMLQAYLNHAHDDYLEVWIECGWAGLSLIGLFTLWWGAQAVNFARHPTSPGASLGLSGALVIGLFLAHSLVDYPLRAPGLAVLFAFACGLIVVPCDMEKVNSPRTSGKAP